MQEYNSSSIKNLSAREHIRLRPSMYIPSVDIIGLHHLLEEVLNNSIDEHLAGFGNKIDIIIKRLHDRSDQVTIRDYGRGIPTGYSKKLGMDSMEAIFTKINTSGKFDNSSYSTSSGLNGVGMKVISALSETLIATTGVGAAKAQTTVLEFVGGAPRPLKTRPGEFLGTEIFYVPDSSIFETTQHDLFTLDRRLKSLSSILPGLELTLDFNGEVTRYCETEKFELIQNTGIGSNEVLFQFKSFSREVSLILTFCKTQNSYIDSFVNTINTYEHGSHVDAVIESVINSLIKRKTFTRSQITQGMVLTISVFHNQPKFRGQHKGKLADSEIKKLVYDFVHNDLYTEIQKNKEFIDYLVIRANEQEKIINELDVKKAISTIRNNVKENRLPSKLSVAHNCSPEDRELFIVEGASAGGTVKTARNPRFQEVLSLKGKPVNALKSSYGDTVNNEEVIDIFLSLGGMENSNTPLRTKNVFILPDADVDGSHIRALLFSIFAKVYPSFIKNFNLYVVRPPLFSLVSGDIRVYGHSTTETIEKFKKAHGNKKYDLYRNKGLGEMSANELEPVINPKTRIVDKVVMTEYSLQKLEEILGESSALRKTLILDSNEEREIND